MKQENYDDEELDDEYYKLMKQYNKATNDLYIWIFILLSLITIAIIIYYILK